MALARILVDRKHLLLLLMTAAVPLSGFSQRVEPMTAARIRALTKEAEAEARDDKNAVVLGLDKRVRALWGDFESFPVSIVKREDLTILLTTPYMSYRMALVERLRRREPLANIPWTDSTVISVSPDRIDAPDIVKIVVERDGKPIPPVKTLLKAMTFTNGTGETAVLHAGEVHFPASAFAPGTTVTVTAIPEVGSNFVLTLSDGQLQELK